MQRALRFMISIFWTWLASLMLLHVAAVAAYAVSIGRRR